MNLQHIESRPDKNVKGAYEFLLECDTRVGKSKSALDQLRQFTTDLQILTRTRTTSSSSENSEGNNFDKVYKYSNLKLIEHLNFACLV